jgi:two-component system cell cycle response regulator/two-component system alkaline phosphatase synthesis response regulator PhoP/putative two-component system response regulator
MEAASNLLELVLFNKPVKYLRAYTPDEGIKLAETEHPDVILLEPFMPVSGFEIYETLQSNQNTKYIPVIFYNKRKPEIETKLKKLGVPYIYKPIDFDELFKYLATYLTVVED